MGRRKTLYTKSGAIAYILITCIINTNNYLDDIMYDLDCSARQVRRYVNDINLTFFDFHIQAEIIITKDRRLLLNY